MSATKRAVPEQGAAPLAPLPPITVAKMRHALNLLDRLMDEHRDRFLERMEAHRDTARDYTTRPLAAGEALEAAMITAPRLGVEGPDAVTRLAADIQGSELRMTQEPDGRELLAAAVASLGGAAFDTALRFVALVELPSEEMEQHAEAGVLFEHLDTYATNILGPLGGAEAIRRSQRAWDAFQQEWGLDSGEAVARLMKPVWGALMEAADRMTDRISDSYTSSLAPTVGAGETSSTTPGTEKP